MQSLLFDDEHFSLLDLFFSECQVKHWSKHKPICEMITEITKAEQSKESQ